MEEPVAASDGATQSSAPQPAKDEMLQEVLDLNAIPPSNKRRFGGDSGGSYQPSKQSQEGINNGGLQTSEGNNVISSVGSSQESNRSASVVTPSSASAASTTIDHSRFALMDSDRKVKHSHTHPKFLHSNSTSHIWPFGAIAELIGNCPALSCAPHLMLKLRILLHPKPKITLLIRMCARPSSTLIWN